MTSWLLLRKVFFFHSNAYLNFRRSFFVIGLRVQILLFFLFFFFAFPVAESAVLIVQGGSRSGESGNFANQEKSHFW